MTPILTLALALAMPITSMAASIARPQGSTKPFGLETREPQDDVSIESENIVGGTTASTAEFPYIVSLSKSSSHFCGGVLLNAYTVVTAAHCSVGQTASTVKVRAGSLVSHTKHLGFVCCVPTYDADTCHNRPGPAVARRSASLLSSTTLPTAAARPTTTSLSGISPALLQRARPLDTPRSLLRDLIPLLAPSLLFPDGEYLYKTCAREIPCHMASRRRK